jgi:hypothetical protein
VTAISTPKDYQVQGRILTIGAGYFKEKVSLRAIGGSIESEGIMTIVVAARLLVALTAVTQDYFPLKEGMQWTYAMGDGTDSIKKVASKQTVDGKDCLVVRGLGAWGVFRDEPATLLASKDGVRIVRMAEFKDLLWLKNPLQAGDKWSSGFLQNEVLGEEEVQVPAGAYKALKVRARFGDDEGTSGEWITWYAAGVGEVKSTVTVTQGKKAPQTFTRVLKKFEEKVGK